jgi:hypothetical protein
MEKIMSKTNDTSNLEHGRLADSELDAVTGGMGPMGFPYAKVAEAVYVPHLQGETQEDMW